MCHKHNVMPELFPSPLHYFLRPHQGVWETLHLQVIFHSTPLPPRFTSSRQGRDGPGAVTMPPALTCSSCPLFSLVSLSSSGK